MSSHSLLLARRVVTPYFRGCNYACIVMGVVFRVGQCFCRGLLLAVAEAECNTVTGLKQVHHAATPLLL
ncbi:hypothetical protein, partial [Pseudomonas aeruginosa]|uniref:hypothetical protein n=1 Tax=Pseudomonas aeruginosa TaxID=287 RepID=UPI00406C66E6